MWKLILAARALTALNSYFYTTLMDTQSSSAHHPLNNTALGFATR
jgi:hypothetical protein